MTKVTDPDILKQLNAPQEAPAQAPAADDSVMGRIQNPNSAFRQHVSDLGEVARGAAQDVAGGVTGFSDWVTGKARPYIGRGVYAIPGAGQVEALSDMFPQTRSAVDKFAGAPITSAPQAFGYGAAEVGQAVGMGGAGLIGKGVKGATKFGGNIAVNEGIWHAAGMMSEWLGVPIWPLYTAMVGAKEKAITGVKGMFTKGAEETAESAVKGAARTAAAEEKPFTSPWGETPTTSTGPKMAHKAFKAAKAASNKASKGTAYVEPMAREEFQKRADVPPSSKPPPKDPERPWLDDYPEMPEFLKRNK